MVQIDKNQNFVEIKLYNVNGNYNRDMASALIDLSKYVENKSNHPFPYDRVRNGVKNGEYIKLEHRFINNLFINFSENRQQISKIYENDELDNIEQLISELRRVCS